MAQPDTIPLLDDLIASALRAGADAADAIIAEAASVSVGRRMDKPERLERSESTDLGLRVFVGQRQATVSSTDLRPETLRGMVERAVSMARAVPEDAFAGLAEGHQLAEDWPELDLCDPVEPTVEELVERARTAEAAAMAVPGVMNSDGVDTAWSRSTVTLVASNGFAQATRRSRHILSVSVLAGGSGEMERDYDMTTAIYLEDLRDPAAIGRSAGERAVRRCNPRKVQTARVPVVLDPRVSAGLVGTLAGAISGTAIARGTSFLKDSLGKQILPAGVSIIDDPFMQRGVRSRPFDGEGISPMRRPIVHDGYLTTWIMDLRSSRQLGLISTGHAARGTGGPPSPSPSNLYMEGGKLTREELLREVGTGFYVTELMGMGRQRHHRRLQPRRGGLLDRERRTGLPRFGSDDRRQHARHVPEPDARQRPGSPLRYRRADPAHRRHDAGGALNPASGDILSESGRKRKILGYEIISNDEFALSRLVRIQFPLQAKRSVL